MDGGQALSERLVVYGDFGDPWSYLASQRVDALQELGVHVEWRAVQWHRRTPVKGQLLQGAAWDEAVEALEGVRAHLGEHELLPDRPWPFVPRTEAAVSAFAEATGAGVADDVRRHLMRAYWEEGTDIGNPEVLRTLLAADFLRGHAESDPVREFGYAVAMTGAPITTVAWRRIKSWRERWDSLRRAELPTVVRGSGVWAGADACHYLELCASRTRRRTGLRRLGEPAAVGAAPRGGATGPQGRTDRSVAPRRLVADRLPATWLTQVGDPWLRESRIGGV